MNDNRGAAMVEMAIILSLLVVLFLGITELGRAVFFQQKMTKAVEASARFLGRAWDAVDRDTCATRTAWTTATLAAGNLAVYGNAAGSGSPVVPGLAPGNLSYAVIARDVVGVGTVCVVQVRAQMQYEGIFGGQFIPLLGIAQPELTAASEERYVGE